MMSDDVTLRYSVAVTCHRRHRHYFICPIILQYAHLHQIITAWVLNAAARVITGTRKFDRGVGQILHDQLHCLDVPDRVLF